MSGHVYDIASGRMVRPTAPGAEQAATGTPTTQVPPPVRLVRETPLYRQPPTDLAPLRRRYHVLAEQQQRQLRSELVAKLLCGAVGVGWLLYMALGAGS